MSTDSGSDPIGPFRPPTWGRVLGWVVLAMMAAAAGIALWAMIIYWGAISV